MEPLFSLSLPLPLLFHSVLHRHRNKNSQKNFLESSHRHSSCHLNSLNQRNHTQKLHQSPPTLFSNSFSITQDTKKKKTHKKASVNFAHISSLPHASYLITYTKKNSHREAFTLPIFILLQHISYAPPPPGINHHVQTTPLKSFKSIILTSRFNRQKASFYKLQQH